MLVFTAVSRQFFYILLILKFKETNVHFYVINYGVGIHESESEGGIGTMVFLIAKKCEYESHSNTF